jgi:chaperonin GroEL (HSP60 family)
MSLTSSEHSNQSIGTRAQTTKGRLDRIDALLASNQMATVIANLRKVPLGPRGLDKIIWPPDADGIVRK